MSWAIECNWMICGECSLNEHQFHHIWMICQYMWWKTIKPAMSGHGLYQLLMLKLAMVSYCFTMFYYVLPTLVPAELSRILDRSYSTLLVLMNWPLQHWTYNMFVYSDLENGLFYGSSQKGCNKGMVHIDDTKHELNTSGLQRSFILTHVQIIYINGGWVFHIAMFKKEGIVNVSPCLGVWHGDCHLRCYYYQACLQGQSAAVGLASTELELLQEVISSMQRLFEISIY